MSPTEGFCAASLIAALLLAAPAAQALPWSKDMVDQPSVKAQEARVDEPEDSVAAKGKEPVTKPKNVSEVVKFRLQAAAEISNPVAPGQRSIDRGEWVYQTHCASCHGAGGSGDGPVGLKYVPPPMDLTTDYVQQQADGQLFYTITHGGVVMPFYRDAIDIEDRWHLINYIKSELKTQ
ncbi:MAG: cytochrome c [Gammaproteobacteria bacterium]|nr:cytochrome c [Gammaproteobacteria bacterium]